MQMHRGFHDSAEPRFFRREALGTRLRVDIGARIGNFGRLLATTTGIGAMVVALEPNPGPFRCLARSTRVLSNDLHALGRDPARLFAPWLQLGCRFFNIRPEGDLEPAAPDTLASPASLNRYCSLFAMR